MSSSQGTSPVVICWYRRALRLQDNPALQAAAACAVTKKADLLHVYVLDHQRDPALAHRNALRSNFLLETLRDLDESLQSLGGGGLHVMQTPAENDEQSAAALIVDLVRDTSATDLLYESESAAWAKLRDSQVSTALKNVCQVTAVDGGHTLYNLDELLEASKTARAPGSMSSFQVLLRDCGEPDEIAPYGEAALSHQPEKIPFDGGRSPSNCTKIPSLSDLGMSLEGLNVRYRGGEKSGMARLEEFLGRNEGRYAATFEKPNTSPAAFEDGLQETTVLSPYLAIGAISPRVVYHQVRAVQKKFKKVSEPPVSLIGQLLWREFFHLQMHDNPQFSQIEGNAVCKKIPWDTSKSATQRWEAWEAAETGYPWIDALMTQLKTEGFVHHLGRHSLACFLTRGDLWVSWELGAKTFEKYLIDFDEALNAGNWMWLSASAYFSAYFRVYSPVAFGKRWSKAPDFIRHYLPALRKVEDKYIFEPWKMPPGVAKRANVIIGKDYPHPIVDHGPVSKENIAKMAKAYKDQHGQGSETKKRPGTGPKNGKVYKMRK